MIESLQRATVFVLYQVSIALGILLLPVALVARRGGVTLPVHQVVERLDRAYDDVKSRGA